MIKSLKNWRGGEKPGLFRAFSMRAYQVPMQLDKEDMIFGGKFSLRQAIYMAFGGGLGLAAFATLYHISLEFALVALILLAGAGYFLGIAKICDMNLDTYLAYSIFYLFKERNYPYMGGGDSDKERT